jgi:hypothetical protein
MTNNCKALRINDFTGILPTLLIDVGSKNPSSTAPLPSPFRFGFYFGLGFIFAQVVFSAVVGLVIIGFMGIGVGSLIANSRSRTPLMATIDENPTAGNMTPATDNVQQKHGSTAR